VMHAGRGFTITAIRFKQLFIWERQEQVHEERVPSGRIVGGLSTGERGSCKPGRETGLAQPQGGGGKRPLYVDGHRFGAGHSPGGSRCQSRSAWRGSVTNGTAVGYLARGD